MSSAAIHEKVKVAGRRRRLLAGFGALLVMALLFVTVFSNAFHASRQRAEADRWHVHTLEVLLTIEAIKAAANAGMRGERGYLITQDESFLRPYRAGRRDAEQLAHQLAVQTRDNPAQRPHAQALEMRIGRLFRTLDMAVALRRQGREADAVAVVARGIDRHAIEEVFAALARIEANERILLAQRSAANAAANARIDGNNQMLAGVGLLLLCVAGAAGVSTMRAQQKVRETAEQLRRTATTDELTGLPNRRFFMHTLEIEVARAERGGMPLSLAVIDLDHFKRINDRYGHAGGDAVLRGFAEVARATMRTGDVVARIGGEEFAILMPHTDVKDAHRACERFRAKVAAAHFAAADGRQIQVTLSTGIALLVAGEERDQLVTRADDALYRAKESGRNQVQLAS